MPYLHCPHCHRTAWVRLGLEHETECRHCGSTPDAVSANVARFLARAVRERFARDARLNAGRPRFVRDRQQSAD